MYNQWWLLTHEPMPVPGRGTGCVRAASWFAVLWSRGVWRRYLAAAATGVYIPAQFTWATCWVGHWRRRRSWQCSDALRSRPLCLTCCIPQSSLACHPTTQTSYQENVSLGSSDSWNSRLPFHHENLINRCISEIPQFSLLWSHLNIWQDNLKAFLILNGFLMYHRSTSNISVNKIYV